MKPKSIYVTQPFLPPLEEYIPYLEDIWNSKVLTNGGKFHQRLEQELCDYLGVEYISLFSNATIALVTALQALKITGEVITTPYSFVATSHALLWNGIRPIFADIQADSFNLDPKKIEGSITSNTTAIMPVHCYGYPCDVDAIDKIAEKYKLKVIYDAAHAFGVKGKNGSILKFGDLSVLSFHATKVFNTFEGGAIVCPNKEMKNRIDQLKNFGFSDEVNVIATGINGKMSELNAAVGLAQLKYIDKSIDRRRKVSDIYLNQLMGVPGISFCNKSTAVRENYGYFPILIEDNYPKTRDEIYEILKEYGIFSRRYFYPLITEFPMYKDVPSGMAENIPIAVGIASKVLCLPIYPDLNHLDQDRVIDVLKRGW